MPTAVHRCVCVHTNDRLIFLMGIPIPRQVYIETVLNMFVHSWRISIKIPYTDSFKSLTRTVRLHLYLRHTFASAQWKMPFTALPQWQFNFLLTIRTLSCNTNPAPWNIFVYIIPNLWRAFFSVFFLTNQVSSPLPFIVNTCIRKSLSNNPDYTGLI